MSSSASPVRIASWNGSPVSVTARLVPRYAWTSATIDVFIEEEPVSRTGGVMKLVGKHSEVFHSAQGEHTAEVQWGRAGYVPSLSNLTIDSTLVLESQVSIQNWWLALWPWGLVLAVACWQFLA